MKTFTIHEPHADVFKQILALYTDLYQHQGHGKMSIEMRFLKRGQKEILLCCGKEYRFVVDCHCNCVNAMCAREANCAKAELEQSAIQNNDSEKDQSGVSSLANKITTTLASKVEVKLVPPKKDCDKCNVGTSA